MTDFGCRFQIWKENPPKWTETVKTKKIGKADLNKIVKELVEKSKANEGSLSYKEISELS